MKRALRVLIVEDNSADAELVVRELRRAGFDPQWERVDTEAEYLDRLHPDLDIILSDFEIPHFGGPWALELLKESGLDIPFIIISGTIGEDTAVAVMKQGATDYLMKDRLTRLGTAVDHAMEESRLRRERKQAEEELRLFRALVDQSSDTFEIIDPETGRFLDVNERSCIRLGYSHAEYLALHVFDVDPTMAPSAWPQVAERVRAAGFLSGEGCHRRKDGTTFPIEYSAKWVRLDRDYIVTVVRDITERKLAEEAFRESERRFRELLENVELIAMTLDKKGTVTFSNDYLLKTTGWNREEVIGADWFSKFIPGDMETKKLFFDTVEAGEIPAHHENPIRTRDGQLRDIVWNNTMLRDAAGNITGTASIGEDVTERKQAEERVREQASMLDQAHDAIVVRGIHDQKITFWNKGAETLYGWTMAEAIGQDARHLHFADPMVPDAIHEKLLKTDEWRGETRHRTKDGKELIVNTRATLVRDGACDPKSVLSINTDITEQKNLEAQFLRAQRLESIGTLASGVAHDLNNILAPIMMSAPMLREKLPLEMRNQIISTIETSAQRGAEIVRQVLTFASGVEGERMLLQPVHLIKEMAKIAKETFPKSITTRIRYSEGIWTVMGDATQLHQVLLNLCVNARDAMPESGELTIAVENLTIDEPHAAMMPGARAGFYVIITVSDTGVGIPSQVIDKIFDPFFTTKELGKGTGLGLSMIIGIVKSHGGFVTVHSEVGRGSSFKVFLPATGSEVTPDPVTGEVSLPWGQGELILVVDDEESILQTTQAMLEKRGYRVVTATDGPGALSLFAQRMNEIKVVLTDVLMPIMDGAVLARVLQKMSPQTPVIACSGQRPEVREEELKESGVKAFLTKPYDSKKLLTTLRRVLDKPESRSKI